MREYDCKYCISEGLYKKRDCMFTEINQHAKNETWMSVPVLDSSQKAVKDRRGRIQTINRRVNKDEFLEVIWDMSNAMTGKSSFEIYKLFFDEICLTAFADSVMFSLIEAESIASEYKGAIGNLNDEDVRFGLLGFYMEYQDLIEAFNVIRVAKKDYERWRFEESQKKPDEGK